MTDDERNLSSAGPGPPSDGGSLDISEKHLLTQSLVGNAAPLWSASDSAAEGRRCGPYRLCKLIGSGGMGSVYEAERADGEVQQRVAIKLLRYAVDDPAFRARFLQERQILASLNHPAIARLLDAGHTADGQPYLVMEFIAGVAIDTYARTLNQRQKLELFRRVCDAVSYAHSHLIVHRDLKPSNILVTAAAEPKLLDFGIAKILDPAAQVQDETVTAFRALTPQYASPEQIRGEVITTASDVYSLGVLLYRLLTGSFPYAFPTTTPIEVERTVCDTEPAPPHLGEDLDNILLMALRKEPGRRYHSVQQLAEDIDRALEDRPVLARPDTIRYRTGKFIRRNRISVTAATVVFLSVLAASVVAIYQARLAQERFRDVRKLAHTFVFELHDEVAKVEGTTKARAMMVKTGLEYLDTLSKDSGNDLDLGREIAAGYMKIGQAEGDPSGPNLGRMDDALASYRKAGQIYARIAAKNPAYLVDLAKYYLQDANLVRLHQDLPKARSLAQSGIQTLEQAQKHGLLGKDLEGTYTAAWCTMGDIDEDMGNYQKAWTSFSRCRELVQMQLAVKRDDATLGQLGQADERIGTAASELGQLQPALKALNEDESVLNELLAHEPRNPKLHRRLGLVYLYRSHLYYDDLNANFGDPGHALADAKQYLQQAEAMVRSDPNNTAAKFSRAIALYQVSFCLRGFDPESAVEMAKQSVAKFDELIASGKKSYLVLSRRVRAAVRLGEAELKAGHVKEARATAKTALEGARSFIGHQVESEQVGLLVMGIILAGNASAAAGDWQEAERLLCEAEERGGKFTNRQELENAIPLANAEEALGEFYAARGSQKARQCFTRLNMLWQQFPPGNEYVDRRKTAAAKLLASLHS